MGPHWLIFLQSRIENCNTMLFRHMQIHHLVGLPYAASPYKLSQFAVCCFAIHRFAIWASLPYKPNLTLPDPTNPQNHVSPS